MTKFIFLKKIDISEDCLNGNIDISFRHHSNHGHHRDHFHSTDPGPLY